MNVCYTHTKDGSQTTQNHVGMIAFVQINSKGHGVFYMLPFASSARLNAGFR